MGKSNRGGEAFEQLYHERFGVRWAELRAALLRSPGYCALEDGLTKTYYLDGASARSVTAVPLQAGDRVLDLCAAPGGKTLAVLSTAHTRATADRLELTANERSRTRRARLQRTLQEHLPAERAAAVRVTGHDARRWGLYEQEAYDHVIADVPCSAERHMLSAPAELARWSPARPKRLAIDGYAILSAAITAARAGGTVLYLTCALLEDENDAVIAKALQRFGRRVRVAPPAIGIGTPTQHGIQVLPDVDNDQGPLYIARLVKRS